MHVLVAVDGSDPSREAFSFALSEFPDAEITALHVIDPYDLESRTREDLDDGTEPVVEAERRDAEALFAELLDGVDDRTIRTETVVGNPEREVVEFAADRSVDHVVVGSHGRTGLSRVLLGSVAETVARRSPVPVTIVRDRSE